MKNSIFIIIVITSLSCSSKGNEDKIETKNQTKQNDFTLTINGEFIDNFYNDSLREYKLNKAFREGDALTYQSLANDYKLSGDKRAKYELFYYSMKMLSKHQTSFAYRDAHQYFKKLNKDDKLFQILAQYYLYKAYLAGDGTASIVLESLYGKNNIPLEKINAYIKRIDNFVKSTEVYEEYDEGTYPDEWDRELFD